MKNMQVLLCVLFVGSALHGAEQKQIEVWKSINCDGIQRTLAQDYESYLKNRLEEYKKTDFTYKDMQAIEYTGFLFTGFVKPIRFDSMLDKDRNSFTHIAIRKADLTIVQWLTDQRYLAYNANSDDKEPIDLCIEQLLPNAAEANKKTVHEILDVLTAAYDTYAFNLDYRKKFLKKMVALQLEYKKCGTHFGLQDGTGFVLKDVLFTRFLIQDPKAKPTIVLSDIYHEVMDQNKNTFTHVVVQRGLPDELYELIKKEYITFEKNAEEKTPVDIAYELFRGFTQNHSSIEARKDIFTKRRCCLFMLLNYLKIKQNVNNKSFIQCCDKHMM